MSKLKVLVLVVISFFSLNAKVFSLTKAPIDVTNTNITELREYLDKGYITSEQLVNLYLERIEAYDKNYNAIRTINNNAVSEAKELDELLTNGTKKGALHGIPIVVKTNIDVVGIPTTAGSKALKDNYPKTDAKVIASLKEAGAIILATTNMSEFAFSAGNSNSSYGKVRNAYNPSYSPYGSSGGSAVATAASFAAASLGTDTNSSVRVPASANNLVGIRPTKGLVSTSGVIPYDITRDTVGILTKNVTDNAIILSIINESKTEYQTNESDNLVGKKIGVINSFLKGGGSNLKANSLTDDEIYNMMLNSIELMKKAGAEIIYIDNFYTSTQYGWWSSSLAGFTFCDGFNEYIKNTVGSVRSFEILAKTPGRIYNIDNYANACNSSSRITSVNNIRSKYQSYVKEQFEKYDIDLIVYPTVKNKTYDLSKQSSGVRAPSTFVSSATGYPSITLPLGFASDNLPYGIEFLSLDNNEQLLYDVTSVYEKENNQIKNPEITPNLYEIPESVTTLIKMLEEANVLETNKIKLIKTSESLRSEIKDFFTSYNTNENVENDSTELLTKLETFKKENSKTTLFTKLFTVKNLTYVVLALAFASLFIKKKKKTN